MTQADDLTEQLIRRAESGDESAAHKLLMIHRERLLRMIAVRIDSRISSRVDPSDVVQEALMDASQKLPRYLKTQSIAFYPWLRRIAWERLLSIHNRHIEVQKRSVQQEALQAVNLPDQSVMTLAQQLLAASPSPSVQIVRKEQRDRLRAALERLADPDREVLVLRYLEQMSTSEIAEVMQISSDAVKTRHFRAIRKLQNFLTIE